MINNHIRYSYPILVPDTYIIILARLSTPFEKSLRDLLDLVELNQQDLYLSFDL